MVNPPVLHCCKSLCANLFVGLVFGGGVVAVDSCYVATIDAETLARERVGYLSWSNISSVSSEDVFLWTSCYVYSMSGVRSPSAER